MVYSLIKRAESAKDCRCGSLELGVCNGDEQLKVKGVNRLKGPGVVVREFMAHFFPFDELERQVLQ